MQDGNCYLDILELCFLRQEERVVQLEKVVLGPDSVTRIGLWQPQSYCILLAFWTQGTDYRRKRSFPTGVMGRTKVTKM